VSSNEFHLPPLPLNLFDWRKDLQEIKAPLQRFGPLADGMPYLGRLYRNSSQVGVIVRSNRTGKLVKFKLEEEQHNGENGLLRLVFVPVDVNCPIQHLTLTNDCTS
jgi:hypothetical protein